MYLSKKILLGVLVYGVLAVQTPASSFFKNFDVKSAIVNYDINGIGKIAENNYLAIQGQASLSFDEWGIRDVYKEKYTETTIGAVKSVRTTSTLKSQDHGVESYVDFEKKKIDKNRNLIILDAIKKGKDLYTQRLKKMQSKGTNIGMDTILGYSCDIWLYKNKKICLYKGIPLKEEFTISGIDIKKVAISIDIDQNISDDVFALPDFKEKRQKGFLMAEDKDTHAQNIQTIKQVIQDEVSNTVEVSSDNIELESGIKVKDDIFKTQKEFLPKLLLEMQESRVCLENANSTKQANECVAKLIEIETKIQGKEDNNRTIKSWTESSREEILSRIESSIMEMKGYMPCVKRSKNLDEISACIENKDE